MPAFDGIFVRETGEGPEPALLLHCGLGQSGMWRGVAGQLAARLRMCAPDLPGHGRSTPFPDGCDVHTAATDAVRPFFAADTHLIGHSFGATIALRLALESPGKVASLTLIEPVFFAAAKGRPSHAPHRASEEAFFEVYHQGDMLAAARVFNRLWGGGVPWDSFRSDMQQAMAKGMPFVVGTEPSLWQDCHALLRPGGLEKLDMPVTLVRGSKSVPIITDVHASLSARIPQAQEIVVPKAAHMLVQTHPDAVAQAILSTVEAAPLERADLPVNAQRPQF